MESMNSALCSCPRSKTKRSPGSQCSKCGGLESLEDDSRKRVTALTASSPGTARYIDGLKLISNFADDNHDYQSTVDSGICLLEDQEQEKLALAEAVSQFLPHYYSQPQRFYIEEQDESTSSLDNEFLARIFASYVRFTGPSLAFLAMDHARTYWVQSLPQLAMKRPKLLGAILALSALQIDSTSSSLKIYHHCMVRIERALSDRSSVLRLDTSVMIFALAVRELMHGNFEYLRCHLQGFNEILKLMLQEATTREIEVLRAHLNLVWSFAKLDVYHSILTGRPLMLPISSWAHLNPHGSMGRSDALQNNLEQTLVVLARIMDYAKRNRHRKLSAEPFQCLVANEQNNVEAEETAFQEWNELNSAHENLRLQLAIIWIAPTRADLEPANPQPKPVEASNMSPDATSDSHRARPDSEINSAEPASSLASINLRAQLAMSHILLLRNRPTSPVDNIEAILDSQVSTADDAAEIYQLLRSSLMSAEESMKSPATRGALLDFTLPLFVAAQQYLDERQRLLSVEAFETIEALTGCKFAKHTSLVVQTVWGKMAEVGRGPIWMRRPKKSPSDERGDSLRHVSPNKSGFTSNDLPLRRPDRLGAMQEVREAPRDDLQSDEGLGSEGETEPAYCHYEGPNQDTVSLWAQEVVVSSKSPSDADSTTASTSDSHDSTISEFGHQCVSLQQQRSQVVDRVMAFFHTVLQATPSVSCRGSHDTSDGSSQSQEKTAGSSITTQAQDYKKFSSSNNGKRPLNGDEDASDDDDERSAKRPKSNEKAAARSLAERRFACPFFKRNSERYITRRSCVGPGWDEVRRVKEHLYRSHRLPFFCPRCYKTFKLEALLHTHQRADEPCPKRSEVAMEGVNTEQEKRLRGRKKSKPEPSEEQKWREMYRILFPYDDDSLMPSPYMDLNWEQVYQMGKVSGSNEVSRYEQFLRRELPAAVRRELEIAAEEEFTPMEERLKSRLIDIVRDVQLQLFNSYTRTRDDHNPPIVPASTETAAPDSGNAQSSDPDQGETELVNELAAFEPVPPLDTANDADAGAFDPILFQFADWEDFNDSAYGSWFDNEVAKHDWEQDPCLFESNNDNGEGSSRSAS